MIFLVYQHIVTLKTLNGKGQESEVKKAKKVRLRKGRVRNTFAFVENLFTCRDAGAPHVRLWVYLVACLFRQYGTEGAGRARK